MGFVFHLLYVCSIFFFFFFSSRRRHTRCSRDWSSDVCSSDLPRRFCRGRRAARFSEAGGIRRRRRRRGRAVHASIFSQGPVTPTSAWRTRKGGETHDG